jgi:hypothetical protein
MKQLQKFGHHFREIAVVLEENKELLNLSNM